MVFCFLWECPVSQVTVTFFLPGSFEVFDFHVYKLLCSESLSQYWREIYAHKLIIADYVDMTVTRLVTFL